MSKTICHILTFIAISYTFTCSCGNNKSNEEELRITEKTTALKKLLFVYNTDIIDYLSKERADTLFRIAGAFPNDYTKHLVYVVTGDCSVCISSLLDFLSVCKLNSKFPVPTIIVKDIDDELIKFYLNKTDKEYMNYSRFTISPDTYAPDGIYLIIRGRVIDYLYWNL